MRGDSQTAQSYERLQQKPRRPCRRRNKGARTASPANLLEIQANSKRHLRLLFS